MGVADRAADLPDDGTRGEPSPREQAAANVGLGGADESEGGFVGRTAAGGG